MREYDIIPLRMVKEGEGYVNRTDFPQDQSFDGQYIGVGFPKMHNLYKGSWNPKRQQMVWSFLMHVDKA